MSLVLSESNSFQEQQLQKKEIIEPTYLFSHSFYP